MFEIKGRYNTAKVFTDNLDETAREQIWELCNLEFVSKSKIRIMPDAHAGAGCTIGTTMTVFDKVVPNIVGVDIGCGMETVSIREKHINLKRLDKIIHEYIPAGFNIRKKPHNYVEKVNLEDLVCKKEVNLSRARLSIGTLGGGNHFIEVNQDKKGNLYIVVHSGSRHLGKQVAEHYQKKAYRELDKSIRAQVPRSLAYVKGNSLKEYLHDMSITQHYASYNRKAILEKIIGKMNLKVDGHFTTIHNYIDMDSMILRKGAISAKLGEKVLIPINMRDGSLICKGKGNPDWNFSAPHGAGRVMSRREAKRKIDLQEFKKTMKGIYSTTVDRSTLDECALAYKPMDEIIKNIYDAVEITDIIRPIYNFKATN